MKNRLKLNITIFFEKKNILFQNAGLKRERKNCKLKKSLKRIKTIYKNGSKIISFYDTVVQKCKFHQHKSPFLINNNKRVVSNKVPFCKQDFKYFIGYKDAKKNETFMHIRSKNECI